MTIIPKSSWEIVEGDTKPIIECPICGNYMLGDIATHGIHADGTVYASVNCKGKLKKDGQVISCWFHDHVRLEGWAGGEIPKGRRI